MKRRTSVGVLLLIVACMAVTGPALVERYGQPYTTLAEKNTVGSLQAFQLNCSVRILCGGGWGSGVWVAPNVILTAKHVVDGAEEFTIELYSGRKITATQTVLDSNDDLALVFVNFTSKYWAPLGSKPLVGQAVTMIGSPLDPICSFNLTHGHVSALIKNVPQEYDPYEVGRPHFIVDCFGAPGNSGGPVFRGKEVIGLCIWGLDPSGHSMALIADVTHLDRGLRSVL